MFLDRQDAASQLLPKLWKYRKIPGGWVLAVPRGGLAIGAVLAQGLSLPMDIILSKKIGHPENPEYAIGAVTLSGEEIDEALLLRENISMDYVKREVERIRESLRERSRQYRGAAKPAELRGKTIILSDDGAATGHSLLSAVSLARLENPKKIVVAVPVASLSALRALSDVAEDVVCLEAPEAFSAIGEFYEDFSPVEDKEAIRLFQSGQTPRSESFLRRFFKPYAGK